MSVLLEGRNVSKRFGGLLAVSDVSFTLNEGEILGPDRAERGGEDDAV